ncbi:MAG: ATP-binding protein [Spirochaetales bacterium]|nr:ATP-binding protein [Spirochaetales bacterium]
MKRDIEHQLEKWKDDKRRMPLLIRGARQVGKSYTITDFGKRYFHNLVILNFEQYPEYKKCFTSYNPFEIIQNISVLTRQEIIPGETLLFLDEIQECPAAIIALRYFYEQISPIHIIGAGSLLEFTLRSESIRVPVGRIQYIFMKPMSFGEFLDAIGEEKARKIIQNFSSVQPISEVIHNHLLALIKKYMILGGMPAVIDEYIATGNLEKCRQIQNSIIQTYRDDFGKYARYVKHIHLIKIFNFIPVSVGNKFKYSHVDPDTQSRDLKEAVRLLRMAGIIYVIKKTSGHALPFEVHANDKHFKTIFLDVGLMQNMCGLAGDINFASDILSINRGAVAEQFVGQELLAYQDSFQYPQLYYWIREKRNSSAEIDYLINSGSDIIPVEIKAGKTGKLKSLHLYREKYQPRVALKISQDPFYRDDGIISLPIYAIESIKNLQLFTVQ